MRGASRADRSVRVAEPWLQIGIQLAALFELIADLGRIRALARATTADQHAFRLADTTPPSPGVATAIQLDRAGAGKASC